MPKSGNHSCKNLNIRRIEKFDAASLLGAPFGVTLDNSVDEKFCADCGKSCGPIIPKPIDLIATLALLRVSHPAKLNGREIKFLRKCMNLKAKDMAEKIAVSAEHLSKLENGHQPIGIQFERLLRLTVCIEFIDMADEKEILNKVKRVPKLDIRSVRSASEQIGFNLSLETPPIEAISPPEGDEDGFKKYRLSKSVA